MAKSIAIGESLIYKGDILLSLIDNTTIGVVYWDNQTAYLKIIGKGIIYDALQVLNNGNLFECIGNIYGNYEHLKVNKNVKFIKRTMRYMQD